MSDELDSTRTILKNQTYLPEWLEKDKLPTQFELPGYLTPTALSATYVRFEDEAGNPLPTRNVVIKVSATTGEIIDIVSEV